MGIMISSVTFFFLFFVFLEGSLGERTVKIVFRYPDPLIEFI